jgi:hypothetical protein
MDDEMRFRLPKEDKAAFEEAADQLRIGLSAFARMACWDKIRALGLVVGKDRDKVNQRRQALAGWIATFREWIRQEPALEEGSEGMLANMQQQLERLDAKIAQADKRGKGGAR